jgi:hypothetical protein
MRGWLLGGGLDRCFAEADALEVCGDEACGDDG